MYGTNVVIFAKQDTFEAVIRRDARETWSGVPKVPNTFPVAGRCSMVSVEGN
jgi:hypothetical protein